MLNVDGIGGKGASEPFRTVVFQGLWQIPFHFRRLLGVRGESKQ